ncbi:Asp23/Gls24 family envelope stress response protein [Nocardioides lentus]|uniref:Asp23/Gls24 family envelope stress response protein n=1 Tax=Nocardioides lentus TaxID=338077 RepID=A0ABN2P153_9ACTN
MDSQTTDEGSGGRTVLTTRVLREIAGLAAREVPGVVDVAAVELAMAEEQVRLRLALTAAWGSPLPDLADDVRRAVVGAVDAMTGLAVVEADVAVVDLVVDGADGPAER